MLNRFKIITASLITLSLINLSCATLSGKNEYRCILKEINSENLDFSFIKLKNHLSEYPGSDYSPDIQFAIIEYHLQNKSYRNAIDETMKYFADYPDDKNTVFVKVILYKILQDYKGESEMLEKLKEMFFSQPLFFIFSDAKTKQYKSILNNTYKIVDSVDKIELIKNNEPLLKITP